jgi:hypothetical protein
VNAIKLARFTFHHFSVIYFQANLLRETIMARKIVDGIVQAVHYDTDGKIDWVRAFLKRGPTWSDILLLDRETLVREIKAGKQFRTGKRVPLMGGTFETHTPLRLVEKDGGEILVAGEIQTDVDCLEGVPLV